jgi:hypothetical protein
MGMDGRIQVAIGHGNTMMLTHSLATQHNMPIEIEMALATTHLEPMQILSQTIQPNGEIQMVMDMVTTTETAIGRPITSVMMQLSGPIMTEMVMGIIAVEMNPILVSVSQVHHCMTGTGVPILMAMDIPILI